MELGDTGLAISALKFIPRALTSSELLDIFSGGTTLSEIATVICTPESHISGLYLNLTHFATESQLPSQFIIHQCTW